MILAILSLFFVIMLGVFAIVLLGLFIAGRVGIIRLAKIQNVKMPFLVCIPFVGDLFEGRLIRHFTGGGFVISLLYFIARLLPLTYIYFVTIGPGFLYPYYDSIEEIMVNVVTFSGLAGASLLRIIAMRKSGVETVMAILSGIIFPEFWALIVASQKNKA